MNAILPGLVATVKVIRGQVIRGQVISGQMTFSTGRDRRGVCRRAYGAFVITREVGSGIFPGTRVVEV